MTNREPESDNIPRPPAGYSCWLDYALSCMDVRSLEIEALFNDDSTFNRDAVRLAADRELDDLRNKAALLDKLLAVGITVGRSTPRYTLDELIAEIQAHGGLPRVTG